MSADIFFGSSVSDRDATDEDLFATGVDRNASKKYYENQKTRSHKALTPSIDDEIMLSLNLWPSPFEQDHRSDV